MHGPYRCYDVIPSVPVEPHRRDRPYAMPADATPSAALNVMAATIGRGVPSAIAP